MFQQAYSLDLRKLVTRAIARGKSCRAAAEQFEVSPATAIRFQQRLKRTGSLQPGPVGRPRGGGKPEPFRAQIIGQVKTQPDLPAVFATRVPKVLQSSRLCCMISARCSNGCNT